MAFHKVEAVAQYVMLMKIPWGDARTFYSIHSGLAGCNFGVAPTFEHDQQRLRFPLSMLKSS